MHIVVVCGILLSDRARVQLVAFRVVVVAWQRAKDALFLSIYLSLDTYI